MRDVRALVLAAITLCLCAGCGNTILVYNSNGAKTVYVVQNPSTGGSSLLGFAATAGASATPTLVLNAPAGEQFGPQAVDASGNLYLAIDGAAPAILVYAAGSSGNATPVRTITNATTGPPAMVPPIRSLAVDSNGQIYAATFNAVTVFAANANGPTTPVRVISGASTMVTVPISMAIDSSDNLYVANLSVPSSVLVFSATATGNAAPARTITSNSLILCFGVGVDTAGNIYATNDVPPASTILEFAAGANGTSTPIRTLTAVSSLFIAGAVADAQGTIYALTVPPGVQGGVLPGTPGVMVFPANASGNTAPTATISSTAWTGSAWGQLAVQ